MTRLALAIACMLRSCDACEHATLRRQPFRSGRVQFRNSVLGLPACYLAFYVPSINAEYLAFAQREARHEDAFCVWQVSVMHDHVVDNRSGNPNAVGGGHHSRDQANCS